MKTRRPIDLNHYRNLQRSGKTYIEIRRIMESEGYLSEEISDTIRQIDDEVLERVLAAANRPPRINFITVGIPLLIIGLLLSLYAVSEGSPVLRAWGFSAAFSAVFMLLLEYRNRRRSKES
ncbi:hypothetical protein V6R21_31895 [Limibacter armeniacum]|uniref:hypothetical protein n=1 Tax=Limibacter armeniacum TaxID=466084 RepID=UPI002FE67F12